MKVDWLTLVIIMTERNISSKELAERAGLHRAVIWKMKSGRDVRESSIKKVADVLGTSVVSLEEKGIE